MTLTPPFPARSRPARRAALTLSAVTVAVLAGCATAPAGNAPAAGTPAAAPAAPTAASPNTTPNASPGAGATAAPPAAAARPGAPPPFDVVLKDAKRTEGFLPLWSRESKTWIEIPADRLEQPFFLGGSLASGLGERFFLPGLMGSEYVVVLRRVDNSVQLIARNLAVRAPDGTPLATALRESYSDSLLASAPLAAAPSKDKQALLVDADVLLGGDISNLQFQVDRAFRTGYALDRANSHFVRERTSAEGTFLTRRLHFAVPKLPPPPVLVPGAPPPNPATLPSPASTVPDPRSFFLEVAYTMAPLPATPMRTRVADQRVGFFTDSYLDLANEHGGDRRLHLINRWRLEKRDAAAAVSEPAQPIRVVLDRNIPERWRGAVKAGVLEWNKAFEGAGFRNAVVVEQQAADASWATTEGTRMLALRWFAMEGPGAVAVGPRQTDPRTGEILRAAAIIPENWVRLFRSRNADNPPRLAPLSSATAGGAPDPLQGGFARRYLSCDYADVALEQAQAGFELLTLRGEFKADSPEAERFIEDALKDVVMHEVGHALGLRHNFKASVGVTRAQLRDPAFTAANGTASSVMDYNALNVPLPGEPVADYHMVALGAYDRWAIEYGYREFPPADEAVALAALAGRSATDRRLAYATDEDVIVGEDPEVNQRDLGDDMLDFADRQMKLSRELLDRTQKRELPPDDDFTVYRRNLDRGLAGIGSTVPLLLKHVGGLQGTRALAGAGQALTVPVEVERQRNALSILLEQVFSSDSFRFTPAFMSRLGVDQFDRFGAGGLSTDFSLPARVLAIQAPALDRLMGDVVALKLANAEAKVADPARLLGYPEVQTRVSAAIWSELKSGPKAIDGMRRTLQREHVRRLAGGVLRPTSGVAADVRAVHRQEALALQATLKRALAAQGWNAISRAHLDDCLSVLTEALTAPLNRQGV